MRTERSSPGTIEAPKTEGRGLRLLKEEREGKEAKAVRATLMRKANEIAKELKLPFSLEEEKGELHVDFPTKERITAKDYEGFDLEELMGNPNFRTETRRVGSIEYTVTERIKDAKGHESTIVRPNKDGMYPEKEDLQAAMMRDFFMAQRWMHKERIFPDEAAIVMHHFDRKPAEWLYEAMLALMASKPGLGEEHAARMAATVINDLLKAHQKRMESL